MPTQINFTYDSTSSIDAAIKEMQAYQEQLTYKCRFLPSVWQRLVWRLPE